MRLRWNPVARAAAYAVEWLSKDREWLTLSWVEGDEAAPGADGLVGFIDEYPGPTGPCGTYRVAAHVDPDGEGERVTSPPVALTPGRPTRAARAELVRRVGRRAWPAPVKAMVSGLRRGPHGWASLLPAAAGRCLGRRIEVEVRSPQLTDKVIDLLAAILGRLPKLAARAERAFADHGGYGALDEADKLRRPRIVIDGFPREGKSAGAWTMVVGVEGSDYAWHVEFARTRFKAIRAGS